MKKYLLLLIATSNVLCAMERADIEEKALIDLSLQHKFTPILGQRTMSLSFRSDGKELAAAVENMIFLYDLDHKKIYHDSNTFAPLQSVTYCTDNKLMAVSTLGRFTEWRKEAWEKYNWIPHEIARYPKNIHYGQASYPDNYRLAYSVYSYLIVKDKTSSHEECTISSPEGLAFSPDGRELACAMQDGYLEIRNGETGQLQYRQQKANQYRTNCIQFSPDGKQLACAFNDGAVDIWGEEYDLQLRADAESPVVELSFSPDGKQLACAMQDGYLEIWDMETGQLQHRQEKASKYATTALCFSPDSQQLASGESWGTIKIWNILKKASKNKK